MTDTKTVVARTLLHTAYVPNTGRGDDAVIASEMLEYSDGSTAPNLKVFKNPKVSFWVTQPGFQDHSDKKEFEALNRLDRFDVPYKDREMEMFKILKGYLPRFITPKQRRELMQSPYLYGGNISVEARVAMSYKKALAKADKIPLPPTTGFLDIEKSLLKSSYGALPLIVFVSENRVFLAMKKSFMYEPKGKDFIPVTIEDVKTAAHAFIDPLVQSIFDDNAEDLATAKHKLPFHYHFFEGETEVDMIKWIFAKIHECKTSFIGIWNLGFDIPEIIKVLTQNNIPLEDVFAHPDFRGTGMALANYREDKRQVHHFTQKWHWMTATAHYQFVDSMSLYSYIRTVDGKETSYALDDILKKFGLGGKLKLESTKDLEGLQTGDWHREMLSKHFVAYALYAMWDGMSLQILEWLNNDLTTMVQAADITPPKFFPNQTILATNTLYEDWLKEGYVLGTGIDIESERDDDLLTAGGAVLVPQNLVAHGVRLFKEWPNHHTRCYVWQNDFDFSAQYPTNTLCLNISKQTKVCTMFAIKGDHVTNKYSPEEAVEVFCSYLITPNSNGVELGTEFFNLPDYAEMDQLFRSRLG